ncbi:MAG: efflux RND transporter periplasmic adaptor subunit [Kiritimatiellae bacterium]|nr:efflux RND transporter periplasmic adaptor subunit [Kiritimatiellia bacterium]
MNGRDGARRAIWRRPGAVAIVLLAFALGFLIRGGCSGAGASNEREAAARAEGRIWICSMHPHVRQPQPGKCPICAMDLVPLEQPETEEEGPRVLAMSETAAQLAEIRTAKVERRFVDMDIRLAGKLDYDETRVKTISAWTAGRLDRLYVDYTGVPVRAGDHLFDIYSPDLYSAQEELVQALKTAAELSGNPGSPSIEQRAQATVEAAREKLRLLGLTGEQVAEVERRGGPPSPVIQIRAPIGGIVIQKHATAGMYVKTGTAVYTVADLSVLWAQLDAYETDLSRIRYGQAATLRTEAYGDRAFEGWVSFIDPVLTARTRTTKVRVAVDNAAGLLRPHMFVRAALRVRLGADGALAPVSFEGKWTCPMHPEVVKEAAGQCEVCRMDLVPAGESGLEPSAAPVPPLVVPASAVLLTGRRAVVYVRVPGRARPTFEGVEVELGPRAGDGYVVRSGLREGQEVVANGSFKIDSALQIQAKPSMMSADRGGRAAPAAGPAQDAPTQPAAGAGAPVPPPPPVEFRRALEPLVAVYFRIQQALAADATDRASEAARQFPTVLDGVRAEKVGEAEAVRDEWQHAAETLASAAKRVADAGPIQKQREAFAGLSAALEQALRRFGPLPVLSVRKAYCPMAFDNTGAYWLQEGDTILNPYFGAVMLRCGQIDAVFSPERAQGERHERRD